MTISRWLHLEELGGDPWVLPILGAVNAAVKRNMCNELGEFERELSSYISIRLNIIDRIKYRIKKELQKLYNEVEESYNEEKNVFTPDNQDRAALKVNNNLKYCLIGDIENFLFEVDTCWDLMKQFSSKLYTHLGKTLNKEKLISKIDSIHSREDKSTRWIKLLASHRNFMVHEGAAYLAIDISKPVRTNWELLILKYNIREFSDKKSFFPYSDLIEISNNFNISRDLLQKHLVSLFEQRESGS